jgi:hypothetical protein
MKNIYVVAGDVAYIFIEKRDGLILQTMVDAEDVERIEMFNHKIYADYKKNVKSHYAVLGNQGFLHRFITNAPKGMVVDHINHDTLDNRKSNLRICTHSENNQNKKGALITSKSGIRGVCLDNRNKKWIAVVRKEKRTVFRKWFDNIQDAETAVIEARQKYLSMGQA